MRLTCWECSTGKFVVVRLNKTNILFPCEGDLVQQLKSARRLASQQPSNSLGLLADCCHVVLVSSPLQLLCLPHVLRQFPFQRVLPDVYCTIDCSRVVEQLHAEVKPLELNAASCWETSEEEDDDIYDEQCGCSWSLDTILKEVQVLTFGQTCNINDVGVQATAHPSGMGIGCAAWVISTPTCRLGFVPQASLHHPFAAVLSSEALRNLDVLLLGPTCVEAAQLQPFSMQTLLSEVCNLVVKTLRNGGNVLLPVLLTGTALALLEQVLAAVESSGLAPKCSPVLFVSPAANRALMTGSTAADSLNPSRQQATLMGQHPFPFSAAKQAGRLLIADSLAEAVVQDSWKTPSCVFVSAFSLDYGAGSQLLKKWAHHADSQVILAEPNMLRSAQEALKLQLPPDFRIKVCAPTCAPGLSLLEVAHLLQETQPDQLVLSSAALAGLKSLPPHSRGMLAKTDVHAYGEGQTLKVPTPKFAPSTVIPSQMVASVRMRQLTEKFAAVRVSCHMQYEDPPWQLLRLPHQPSTNNPCNPMPQPCLWGSAALQPLLNKLEKQGADVDIRLERTLEGEDVTEVHILNWDAVVRLSTNKTEIKAATLAHREKLGKAVVEALQSF